MARQDVDVVSDAPLAASDAGRPQDFETAFRRLEAAAASSGHVVQVVLWPRPYSLRDYMRPVYEVPSEYGAPTTIALLDDLAARVTVPSQPRRERPESFAPHLAAPA